MLRVRLVQFLVSSALFVACAVDSSDSLVAEPGASDRDAGAPPAARDGSATLPSVPEGGTSHDPAGCTDASDGAYCGAGLGLDVATLYTCGEGAVVASTPCALGCLSRPPGTPDVCAVADPCVGAPSNGGYCGGPLGGDQSALYTCRDGKTLSFAECEYGCALQPAGTNDRCVLAPDAESVYHLPIACGTSSTITQGNASGYSHAGKARYAYDFRLPRGSTLVAMQAGTVRAIRDDIRPGHACWSGGGSACADQVNRVVLDHPDGTSTLYLHLDSVSVAVGAAVARGQKIGLSGGTGWSTGPHAHVQRQVACASSYWCQSVPLRFAEVAENDGVPVAGATVTAGPCP